MTNEEAIKHLKAITKWTNFFGGCYLEKLEAIKMAVSALDKQIPQKPFETYDDDTAIYKHFECPNCGERQSRHASIVYCMGCGTAIDWGEDA